MRRKVARIMMIEIFDADAAFEQRDQCPRFTAAETSSAVTESPANAATRCSNATSRLTPLTSTASWA